MDKEIEKDIEQVDETPEIESEIKVEGKAKTKKQKVSAEQTKITELTACVEEEKNKALRAMADLENYRRRNKQLASEMYADGKIDVIKMILPIGDACQRALDMKLEDAQADGILKIKKSFDEVLNKLEVEKIPSLGEDFDPNIHNAIMQMESEGNENKIVQVYEEGYRMNSKIIRHAQVIVGK